MSNAENPKGLPINPARRRLLGGVAGVLAGGAGGVVGGATSTAAHAKADWDAVRAAFWFSRQAPLNAANLCPAFTAVLDAQQQFAENLSADVGFLNRRERVRGEVAQAREDCARMLGIRDTDDLAFVRNTSEANAVIVNGLDLEPEDEVLLWRENHASNYRSWHYRHTRRPFRVRTLGLDAGQWSDDEIVAAFLRAIGKNTRVVSFSHLSNISGTLLPAAQICRAIHARDPSILVHVDGAQSWGSVQVDLEKMDCDSYSSSAHKWLCGPRGVGILYIRKAWAQRVHPLILGYNFDFDFPEDKLPANAARFESTGQRDTAACAAVGVAARQHLEMGGKAVQTRISDLTQHALQAFDSAGIPVRTPRSRQRGHGVVVADLGGAHKSYGAFLALHNAGVASAFVHGNRVHCTPAGQVEQTETDVLLRICPHIYNTTAEIDAAVGLAERIRRSNFEIIKEVVRFL